MIALMTELPRFCPYCGVRIHIDKSPLAQADWRAHASMACRCGLHYQLVDEQYALAAATDSGGDLAQWVNR